MKKIINRALAALFISSAATAFAAVPNLINFQGRLLNTSMLPQSGTISMAFKICDSLAGTCSAPCNISDTNGCLWTETQSVTLSNGVFAVQLGSVTALGSDVFSAAARYLDITVGADPAMAPREQLIAGPFAFKASVADSLAANAIITASSASFTVQDASAPGVTISSGLVVSNGTITMNSGAVGAINIGNAATAGTLNLGTGTGVVETINIGGTGANDINIADAQAAGSLAMGSAMTTGTIGIGGTSQTGLIMIGSGTVAQEIAVAGGNGIKTVNIATGTAANFINLGGTGANYIGIGDDQAAGTISLGSHMTTGIIGIGGVSQTGSILIGTNATTGVIAIGSGTQTGNINIGDGTGAQIIHIGNGSAGAKSIIFGNALNTTHIGVGQTNPTAALHLKAGTATAGAAPLKFTSGTNLGTTEAGAVEYDGSHLYFTALNAGTRYQLDQQAGSGANTTLSNLGVVAINTSLIDDTNKTDDLGSAAINWRDIYAKTVIASSATFSVQDASAPGVTISSGLVVSNGTITMNSGAVGAINIGNAATAGTLNLGTGTGVIETINIGGTGANDINLGDVQAAGAITLGSAMTTGTIGIGGTGQTGNIIIGSGTANQEVDLAFGSGIKTVNIATGTSANIINIGGSGANYIGVGDDQAAGTISLGSLMTSGTIAIGSGTNTGNINIGDGTGAQTINIGNGTTNAKAINIGGTAANVIGIGNSQVGGSISLGAAAGAGTVIAIGSGTANTGNINIGDGTGAQVIHIGNSSAGAKTIIIGNTVAGSNVGIGMNAPTALLDLGPSTTARASLGINSGPAPTTPNDGDVWYDSTQKTLVHYVDGIKQMGPGVLFTQTVVKTVANNASATTLTNTGVGSLTLPANFFVVGKTIRITASGYYGTNSTAPTLTMKVLLGGTAVMTNPATTVTLSQTTKPWNLSALITCYSVGSPGTVWGQGNLLFTTATSPYALSASMVDTAAVNATTTGTLALDLQVTWGTANNNNTITLTNLVVEALN